MSSKVNTITASDIARVAGVSGKFPVDVMWHSTRVTIKQMLNLHEFISLINDIAVDCIREDGSVAFELVDFSIKANIILYYASVEMPSGIDEKFYCVYMTDLYDTVYRYASKSQIDAVVYTVEKYILKLI